VAVVEAVGDAATLAQAIGETASSPWVIANQISLNYSAQIVVSKDARAATWPPTARSWRLEAKIDGTTALSPITATFNANGDESGDVKVNATAPFGGKTITWSFVTLDASGNQVGTGMSAQLANDDSSNPPADVAFAITELRATVDADTVFKRDLTTSYTASTGGYTWASGIADTGTIGTSAVQDVVGVTVATRLGVVGVTWKQGDKYWLRGIPMAEDGTSITLGPVTQQGYARRPYLLFDSFVSDGDISNHVLLEPNDTDLGYTIRRVDLDPKTGAITWDTGTSLGSFPIAVSAAALHSSGRVVAIHTDFGRIGQLLPTNTTQPALAAFGAGNGGEIGLLSSPIALAITNPGVIIVLEAGANQLSAFDLNANPLRYFFAGTGQPLGFTLALPTKRTWLDISVEGSGQIYLLSSTGDGSDPADYHLDVYTSDGQPLATKSSGVNAARLAVDYWRSIYVANFTALLDTASGKPRIDPAIGVAEPSVSRLDPAG
jgi:hypothetical protein